MKRLFMLIVVCVALSVSSCGCKNFAVIGGSDGPTEIIVSEDSDSFKKLSDTREFLKSEYIDEKSLPSLDIHIETPFKSMDRTLVLNDSVDNEIELFIYDYFKNIMCGDYSKVKAVISGDSLLAATENSEINFNDGIYLSKMEINDISLLPKDSINKIQEKNIFEISDEFDWFCAEEFAIVKVCYTLWHNEKSLERAPQVGNGEVERYFLVLKKAGELKIAEEYWEGFCAE